MIYRELTLSEINPGLPEPKTPCRIYACLQTADRVYEAGTARRDRSAGRVVFFYVRP